MHFNCSHLVSLQFTTTTNKTVKGGYGGGDDNLTAPLKTGLTDKAHARRLGGSKGK